MRARWLTSRTRGQSSSSSSDEPPKVNEAFFTREGETGVVRPTVVRGVMEAE